MLCQFGKSGVDPSCETARPKGDQMATKREDEATRFMTALTEDLTKRAAGLIEQADDQSKSPTDRQLARMSAAVVLGVVEAIQAGLVTIGKMEGEGGTNG